MKERKGAALCPEDAARQEAFYNVRLRHSKMNNVLEQLAPLLTAHTESVINLVVGATGVGKTALTKALLKDLWKQYSGEAYTDPSSVPIVCVEAYTSGENKASFKGLFQDILNELNPLAGAAAGYEVEQGRIIQRPSSRLTTASLRMQVEKALRYRKVRVVVIDEAYHLCRLDRDSGELDTLKSIANTSQVKLVLVGSFDLYNLVSTHAQVARRSSVLLFERYQHGNKADHAEWRRIVDGLLQQWPSEYKPPLATISDALLDACLGCVGLLKSMLLDASAMQLANGGRWEDRFLASAVKAGGLRDVICQEIALGEERVRESLRGASFWDDKAFAKLCSMMKQGNHADAAAA